MTADTMPAHAQAALERPILNPREVARYAAPRIFELEGHTFSQTTYVVYTRTFDSPFAQATVPFIWRTCVELRRMDITTGHPYWTWASVPLTDLGEHGLRVEQLQEVAALFQQEIGIDVPVAVFGKVSVDRMKPLSLGELTYLLLSGLRQRHAPAASIVSAEIERRHAEGDLDSVSMYDQLQREVRAAERRITR